MVFHRYTELKNKFTRMCIGEAVIALLQNNPLKGLHISDVVNKAGVSRMTYYKYYTSPQSALQDYLKIIIAEYLDESGRGEGHAASRVYDQLLFAFHFFDRYRTFFLTMLQRGMYDILIDSVNDFVTHYVTLSGGRSVYHLYSYAGSLLNCFLMWEKGGRKESAEDVARGLSQLYVSWDAAE